MLTKNKPRIDLTLEPMSPPVRSPRWTLLWFHVEGKSKIDHNEFFDTEEQANDHAKDCLSLPEADDGNLNCIIFSDGTIWPYDRISHYIPMPIGGE